MSSTLINLVQKGNRCSSLLVNAHHPSFPLPINSTSRVWFGRSTVSYQDSTSTSDENQSCSRGSTKPKLSKKDKILREKTPMGKLEELEEGSHPYQEKEPLKPFPGGVNPNTGEVGGPKGPEPTRYGDWERKGRVTDF